MSGSGCRRGIDLLIQNRDAITRYIEALDAAATRSRKVPAG